MIGEPPLDPGLVPLETLAAAWLAAEESTADDPQNVRLVNEADRLARAYESALNSASTEDVRLAWEAAQRFQAAQLIGSPEWAAARRVAELLRTEYRALRS